MKPLNAKVIKKNELGHNTLIKISKIIILASIIFLMILIMATKASSEIDGQPVNGGDSDYVFMKNEKKEVEK